MFRASLRRISRLKMLSFRLTRPTRIVLAVTVLATLPMSARGESPHSGYIARPEVRAFIDTMQTEHGFAAAELERILASARHQPTVVRLIGPAPTTQSTAKPIRSYPAYRAKFVRPARIAAGIEYWETNEEYLRRAEAEYGVPTEVILGILGVETAFGRNTGSFRVLDALATIAFDGPRRQDYFREELKELLLLARDTGLDPLALKGSYAGAVGLPQFMPSSYRRYAVDFDQDGSIDLLSSPADAIGSIASYLKAHGWVSGQEATLKLQLPAARAPELVSGLQRVHKVPELQEKGVKFPADRLPEDLCSVVELPTPGKQSRYVAGFANFEAITRYNRSTFYAMAVLDLADAIRSERMRQVLAKAEDADAPSS